MPDTYSIMEQGRYFLRLEVETAAGGLGRVVLRGDAQTKELTDWTSVAQARKAFETEKARYEKERSDA